LVVASWVDDEIAQDLAGSGVGSADADVAESVGDAEGDAAGFVDLVASGAVVRVGAGVALGRDW
jgi:hypothetical protein